MAFFAMWKRLKKNTKKKNRLSQKPDIIMVFENGVLIHDWFYFAL